MNTFGWIEALKNQLPLCGAQVTAQSRLRRGRDIDPPATT